VATLAVTSLGAAEAETTAPCAGPAYRAFDFWLGTFEVSDPDGVPAGVNRITAEEQGCVVVERWRSVRGVTGRSFSFYDPKRGAWRQIWISPGSQIELEGNLHGTHMVLEGEIRYLRNGVVRPFRGTWAPLPDGNVHQTLEEGAEAGGWTPWFEGIYRRVTPPVDNLDNRERL
jgi:hypothetical protein